MLSSFWKKENIYDISSYTDAELLQILDLNKPTDRELEAKILHYVHKYTNMGNESGEQLAQFFIDIYARFFDVDIESTKIEGMTDGIDAEEEDVNTGEPAVAEEKTFSESFPEMYSAKEQKSTPEIKLTEYKRDKLNPLLKDTITNTITINSLHREDKNMPPTQFTFNLSQPLRDVVSIKLYSYAIPYTWYTVNRSFGGNFFYIKGNAEGINNGNHDYKVQISSGNYTPANLVIAINNSITGLSDIYTDVDFGNTGISYNENNSLATLSIDITKIYNSSNYYLEFPHDPLVPPPGNQQYLGQYLGFNYQSYSCSALYSSRDLPLIETNPDSNDNIGSYYEVTETNKKFQIVQYVGEYYGHELMEEIEIIDVELTSLINTGSKPRNTIVSELVNVLAEHPNLDHVYSYIERIDITEPQLENNGKSYFKLNIKLDRQTTINKKNAKIAVIFPDEGNSLYPIWVGETSCFHFEYLENELNLVIAETEMKQSNYVVSGTMSINLDCELYPFNTPYNSYIINIPNSSSEGYLLSDYISTINLSVIAANTEYSISENLNDLNWPNTKIIIEPTTNNLYFNVDINRVFRNKYYTLEVHHRYIGDIGTLDNNGNVIGPIDLSNTNVSTYVNYFNIGSYILNLDDVIIITPKDNSEFVSDINSGVIKLTIADLLNTSDGTNKVAVNEHPKYVKYFDMLDAGFDIEYIKQRMQSEGKNPNYLDTPELLIQQVRNSITFDSYARLQDALNTLFTNFTDYNGNSPLRNSRVSITTANVGGEIKLKLELNLVISKSITQLNYSVTFFDSEAENESDNRWSQQLFFDEYYLISDEQLNTNGSSTIINNEPISDNEILIESGINNYFYLKPYDDIDGLYTTNNTYAIKIEIPPRTYSRNTLYSAINTAFASSVLANKSSIESYYENGKEYSVFKLNIQKIFETKDYRIVFYDPTSFATCNSSGVNRSVRNATWDSTIGWLLGFRQNTSYFLEDYIETPTELVYFDDTNINKCILIGDTCVTVSLYNYFMIVLDDFNQNHLNDGVITTSMPERLIDIGKSFTYICDPITNTKVLSTTNNRSDTTNQLTASQVYSNNQKILAKKVQYMSYSTVPFVKDIFALISIGTSKFKNGDYIAENTGSLQVQERVYFGPVNISRMTVKLLNDKGDLVDLNNSDWSFSIQVTSLYNSNVK
jgi:hypothetical protein